MFVTTKRFNQAMNKKENDIQYLNDRYWRLLHKYNCLIEHLGLIEVDIPAKTVLKTKCEPENC